MFIDNIKLYQYFKQDIIDLLFDTENSTNVYDLDIILPLYNYFFFASANTSFM
jgi:hypothetical protein